MTAIAQRIQWRPRLDPLPAAAVLSDRTTRQRLISSLRARVDFITDLRCAANSAWMLVLGPQASLPWIDGVTYLGWDAGLLTPTSLEPIPSAAFLAELTGDSRLIVLHPGGILRTELPQYPIDLEQLDNDG